MSFGVYPAWQAGQPADRQHDAAFSGLMDIVLALLPWKIIWAVTINKKEKLGALVAMSAGVL